MMASAVTLKTLGRWDKEIGVPLRDALAVSMDVIGKTGEKAARQALVFMAESARKLTKQAKPNRPVLKDVALHGASYVDNYRKGKTGPQRLYKFQFTDQASRSDRIPGTWENARKIGNRGLAKRSWFWGLSKLGKRSPRSAIRGASRVYTISQPNASGYIKENRLDYILKAMPAGWERTVEMLAGNRIMAMAREKLEARWRREMGMPKAKKGMPKASAKDLSEYFLRGLS